MIGKTISHYKILSKLGEGGMGVVYQAEDLSLGRQVAVKLLSSHLISDPKAQRRFLHEAKAAAALDHPGICAIYDAGEVDGQLFIAMALLEGQTLQERIAGGPLPTSECLKITMQVADALREAHGKGIVHRDIKPANIMLLPRGQAKVMDFGLAQLAGATQLTRTGMTLGTASYMSPEQARGEGVDERTDIWSLGVVLYELVSGRQPFRGEYEPALKYAILHDEPEALTAVRTGVPPELERIVGKCLEKKPLERYQGADEVLEDLKRLHYQSSHGTAKAPARPAGKPLSLPASSATAVQILGDRYRIERLLGRGGMGEVWLAFDLKLGVEVALKFLLPELSSVPQRIALLRQEVRSARNVASPHVCRVFDLIEIEGQELVSMEYVDGTTLQELLAAQSPLEIVEAHRIATQLLRGLQDIHNAGLIHRDLKPANIMLTRSGRTVVMDFGLAKGVADTQTIAVGGTPAYMSPEQMRGEELDPRADLYAVGIILAEMVAPEGVRDPAIRRKLWDGLRQDPAKAPAGPWEGAIRRAVAANRGERFASAAEMARSLGDVGQRLSRKDELSPYPGLSMFTGDQARFFFGREIDVESIWRKIDRLSLAALIGPSGVGKSSFLRAGVIAAKPEGWNVAICTPGDAPFTSLGQSLLPEFAGQIEAMRDLFRLNDIERSIPLLHGWRQRSKQALLIVDQFEELFTLNAPEVQSRFAELLGRLSVEADVHILVSMRDDFFFLCHQYPALRPLFLDATPLGPLSAQDLRRAIVEPARLCGFAFEDDALVDQVMAEVEGERGALPLVAFAAARLWELRDREHGMISRRSYEEIGRVGGALAQHAESTLERIGREREEIVREIFRNLVTSQRTRVVRERDELLSVFEDRAVAEEVLKALIDARLLTSFEIPGSHETRGERRRIEIVHESLLTSWPRLVRWQTQDTNGAQLRDQLRQAAQLWKERNESEDLLWTGTVFKEFELWRERYPGGLTETEEAFAQAAAVRAGRQRRRRRLALGVAFAVLLGVIVTIGWYARGENIARQSAEAGRMVAMGRLKLETDPSAALAYALASLELCDSPANRRFALEALSRGPTALVMPFPGLFEATSLAFSPDGKRLAIGGFGGMQVLSQDGSAPVVLEDFASTASSREPQFAPDGDHVIFRSGRDKTRVCVWSLSEGKESRSFKMEGLTWVLVRGNRAILVTRIGAGEAVVRGWAFDESDPKLISRWNRHEIYSFDIDRSGQWVAYAKGHGIYVSPVEGLDSRRERFVGEHAGEARIVAFDPTGGLLASADTSGEIRLWSLDGDSKGPLRVIAGKAPVEGLWFDPSGTMLAAVCTPEMKIYLWDLKGPIDANPVVLEHSGSRLWHDGSAISSMVAIDPSGNWIATAYGDELVLWPLARPNPYVLKEAGFQSLFTHDGQSLIGCSHSYDDIRIWNLKGGATRELWRVQSGLVIQELAVDPRGRFVVVGCLRGAFLVALPDGKERQLPLNPPDRQIAQLAVNSDGRLVAGAGYGSEILVWDLESDTVRVLQNKTPKFFRSFTFSEDGSLFSGDAEGYVRRWNTQDGSSTVVGKGKLSVVKRLAVTRDARFLFANFWSTDTPSGTMATELTLFDLKNQTSRSITTHGNKVTAVTLDPSETILVTGDPEGVVRAGPITGEEPHLLFRPPDPYTVVVSPDGRWIMSGGGGSTILWRMPQGRPLHTLPHKEFLSRLRALTNLRVVSDKNSPTGYRLDCAPFPGWEKVPTR